jgi:hypothetical protein
MHEAEPTLGLNIMKDIRVHPTRGLDPHFCHCRNCGDKTEELALGHLNWILVDGVRVTNAQVGQDTSDVKRKVREGMEIDRSRITHEEVAEGETVPGGLCSICESEREDHQKEVSSGGVFWKCESCGGGGVIKAGSELAIETRKAHDLHNGEPCGVALPTCPLCTGDTQ